jgi:hypothetical protein
MTRRKPRHIKVARTPKSAYNPDRPVSSLIANQVLHLYRVEGTLPRRKRTGVNIERIATEGQASRYIRKMTRLLHPAGAKTVKARGSKARRTVTKRRPGKRKK